MIRTTAGNWINYGVTFVAQILFAKHFGSSPAAAAYTVTFSLMAALSSILINSAQSVVLPRLVDSAGAIRRGPLQVLAIMTTAACLGAGLLLAGALPVATALARMTGIGAGMLTGLVRIAAVTMLLQLLAGELIAVNLARGRRFLPGVAPAFPSAITVGLLVASATATVQVTFIAFAAGSLLEVLVLLAVALPGTRLSLEGAGPMGVIAGVTILQFALISTLVPFERVVAATISSSSAARYDYAMKTIIAAQSLVVAGISLAGLGSWSALVHRGRLDALRRSVGRVVLAGTLALVVTASAAMVSMHQLVAIVYQHGHFTASDTDAVSRLLVIALPGYVALGVTTIMTTALAAVRKNWWLIALGIFQGVTRSILVLVGAHLWGVNGIPAAYSTVAVTQCLIAAVVLARVGLWPGREAVTPDRSLLVATGTLAVAVLTLVFGQQLPGIARAVVVSAAFLSLLVTVRPPELQSLRLTPLWRGRPV